MRVGIENRVLYICGNNMRIAHCQSHILRNYNFRPSKIERKQQIFNDTNEVRLPAQVTTCSRTNDADIYPLTILGYPDVICICSPHVYTQYSPSECYILLTSVSKHHSVIRYMISK